MASGMDDYSWTKSEALRVDACPPGWLTTKELAEAGGCSDQTISVIRRNGDFEFRFFRRGNHYKYFHEPAAVKVVTEYMSVPGRRRKWQRQKFVDGERYLSCNKCDEFRHEEMFRLESGRKKARTASGRSTFCAECDRTRSRIRWGTIGKEARKSSVDARKRREERVATEGARIAAEWRNHKIPWRTINKALDQIRPSYENDTEMLRQNSLGPDVIRLVQRKGYARMDEADRLFTALGHPDIYAEITPPPPTMEGWSRVSDCCVLCGTIETMHASHGQCVNCYHRARRGLPPKPANGWSSIHPCCQRCGRSDLRHAGRGLCTSCLWRVTENGTVERYPRITDQIRQLESDFKRRANRSPV